MIARLLGHRRVKSTARYAHLDDRDVVRAAERVGKVVDGWIEIWRNLVVIYHLRTLSYCFVRKLLAMTVGPSVLTAL
jgi:hypothetical protein